MTVAQFRAANPARQLLLKAVVFSLAIHLSVFGGWKWGRTHIHWKPLPLPAWLQVLPHNLRSATVRNPPLLQHPQSPPLIYVDVDPAMAAPQPPANPKFYSTQDSVAANPEIKVRSEQPQISGTQEQVVKTVAPGSRSVPLQPSPPVERTTEPSPTETRQTAESKALPKQAYTIGDMAEAKPASKTQEKQGTSDTDNGTGAVTDPAHTRPRLLRDVADRAGAPGAKMRQTGGVNRLEADSSVDAMRTVYGDYDRDFIDAVQERWYELLKGRQVFAAGKVVLEFNLHADGRISDMKMQYSDVGDEVLSFICQQAVLDPALYKPWPAKMRGVISDPRPIRFTFYYYN
jgi:hypothetical protein